MKLIKIILIVHLVLLYSCKRTSNIEYEIIGDILPELVNQLKISYLNLKLVPPPIYDSDSMFVRIDSVLYKKNKLKHSCLLDSIKNINPKLLIAFNDSLKIIYSKDLRRNLKKDVDFYDSIVKKFDANNADHHKVAVEHKKVIIKDLELTTFEKLVEKYGSHPKVWFGINDRFFGGLLSIEGIVLNEEKNYGLMVVYYANIPLDGFDYILFQ